MKNFFISLSILIISCTEAPTFVRDNPTDPKSDFYEPDTNLVLTEKERTLEIEVSGDLSIQDHILKEVTLNWPKYDLAEKYNLVRLDMFGEPTLVGIFDDNILSVRDTVGKGGYTYVVYRDLEGYLFPHSFGEIDISHFKFGPSVLTDKFYDSYDLVNLGNNELLMYECWQNSPGRYSTEIYSFDLNEWRLAANPKFCGNTLPIKLNDNQVMILGSSGTQLYNINENTWSQRVEYSQSITFSVPIITEEGEVLLFSVNQSKSKIYQLSESGNITELSTHPDEIKWYQILKIGGKVYSFGGYDESTNSYTRNIYEYDITSNNWLLVGEMLSNDNFFTLNSLADGRILIYRGRQLSSDQKTDFQIYNPSDNSIIELSSGSFDSVELITELKNGLLLITYGRDLISNSLAEYYYQFFDPITEKFSRVLTHQYHPEGERIFDYLGKGLNNEKNEAILVFQEGSLLFKLN